MSEPAKAEPASREPANVEEIAHLALLLGRVLLLNGADTEMVEAAVVRFASIYGCEARILATYEGLLLTVASGAEFHTKIGHRVPAMVVGMATVGALDALLEEAEAGNLPLASVRERLEAAEHRPAEYPRWLVVVAIGVTTASLSRLFGGDWPTFGATFVAGAAGTWLRQMLGARRVNVSAVHFLAACLGAGIGGAAVRFGANGTPALCLIAPGMVLMPGVPLINGVQDMIRNHVTVGLSRLAFAALIVVAIAAGLFVATVLTGVAIPVAEPARLVPVPEDAVFSALAALGYALLFNVPPAVAWACVLCGIASHTLRTACGSFGIDPIVGTLIGALVAGFLAQGFGRRFHAPAAAFAFAGVVAMIPGAFAFRAFIGATQIAHGATDPALVTDTFALCITVGLMVAAIAIGIAAPTLIFSPRQRR